MVDSPLSNVFIAGKDSLPLYSAISEGMGHCHSAMFGKIVAVS
jgi:hypothetical protein